MEGRTKFLGHPVHQMLVPLPFGLLVMAVILDGAAIVFHTPDWSRMAFMLIGAGVITAAIAAPFGFRDWLAIPARTRAKRVGAVHGLGNLFVILFFAMSWAMRGASPTAPGAYALTLSFVGGALALFTGWLGGELVDRLGIGVDDGANLNAPSSLKRRRVA